MIAYNNRGGAYRYLKMYLAAIKDFKQSIALGDVGANLGLGMTYNAMRNYDGAIATFTKVLDISERGGDVGAFDVTEGYVQRAQAYEQKKLFDQAIADCASAISKPTIFDDYGFNCRAWALHLKGDDADGLPDANAAVSKAATGYSGEDIADIKTEWAGYLANDEVTRAEIYKKLGQRDNAIADYRAALNLVPNLKTARAGLKSLGQKP
jgi:tetratricopeptide (TPR) repeat protein